MPPGVPRAAIGAGRGYPGPVTISPPRPPGTRARPEGEEAATQALPQRGLDVPPPRRRREPDPASVPVAIPVGPRGPSRRDVPHGRDVPPPPPPAAEGGAAAYRQPRQRPNYALRRVIALAVVALALFLIVSLVTATVRFVGGLFDGQDAPRTAAKTAPTIDPQVKALTPEVAAPTPSPDAEQGAAAASGETTLVKTMRLASDKMTPKSIVAGPSGLLFAQNMMYRHSMSVFTPDGALVKTIPDRVDLAKFGIAGHPGVSKGAPVEMAFSPDGKHAWVSNYSMYGAGFGPEGLDSCRRGDGTDTSYLYRVDTATFAIDKVTAVGAVPKYVAATPDGKQVLVSNWCGWDLSIVDAAKATESAKVVLPGAYPRGIAVSPDSKTAYVALMGSDKIVAVDLAARTVSDFARPGGGPRHIVISPDGKYLYVSNNRSGDVVKLDRASGQVLAKAVTGSEPRSVAISTDGQAIYVVNYGSGSMSKVRTSDMTVLQTVPTDASPIGITYEPTKKQVWVACYGGSVLVFDDSKLKG